MNLPMSPKQRRDVAAGLLRAALTARDTTPAEWLAEQVPDGGRIEYADVRNRLVRLVPLGQRHPGAADIVIVEALADLYGRVHVAQPGIGAGWIVDGPRPDKQDGPEWAFQGSSSLAPAIDRERLATTARAVRAEQRATAAEADVERQVRVRDLTRRIRKEGFRR
jgi:hypothetical protein